MKYLNSVTSVSHFLFGASAVNSRFSRFSAIYCGLTTRLVHPLFAYLIVDFIFRLRHMRKTRLSFALIS